MSSNRVYRLSPSGPSAEPEGADGAAGHPGVHDGRPHRAAPRSPPARRRPRAARKTGREPAAPKSPDQRHWGVNGDKLTRPDALADPVGVIVGWSPGGEPALGRSVIARGSGRTWQAAGPSGDAWRSLCWITGESSLTAGRRRLGRTPTFSSAAEGRRVNISPPACAECGKQLRSYQRRGEDWYCSSCGSVRNRARPAAASGASPAATVTGSPAAPSALPRRR